MMIGGFELGWGIFQNPLNLFFFFLGGEVYGFFEAPRSYKAVLNLVENIDPKSRGGRMTKVCHLKKKAFMMVGGGPHFRAQGGGCLVGAEIFPFGGAGEKPGSFGLGVDIFSFVLGFL